MKETLKALIQDELYNPHMLNAGSEDLYSLVQVETKKNEAEFKTQLVDAMVGMQDDILGGMDEDVRRTQESLMPYMTEDFANTTAWHVGVRVNREVSFYVFGDSPDNLVKCVPDTVDITQLYFVWTTWPEGQSQEGRVRVIHLGDALKATLAGQSIDFDRKDVHAFV